MNLNLRTFQVQILNACFWLSLACSFLRRRIVKNENLLRESVKLLGELGYVVGRIINVEWLHNDGIRK